MATATLYSSAPTLDSIRESVTDFYGGQSMTLCPRGVDLWAVVRTHDGKELDGVRVIRKRGRFRFEESAL